MSNGSSYKQKNKLLCQTEAPTNKKQTDMSNGSSYKQMNKPLCHKWLVISSPYRRLSNSYLVGHGLKEAGSVAEPFCGQTDPFSIRVGLSPCSRRDGCRATETYPIILHTGVHTLAPILKRTQHLFIR